MLNIQSFSPDKWTRVQVVNRNEATDVLVNLCIHVAAYK
jgi:hypothetical protein